MNELYLAYQTTYSEMLESVGLDAWSVSPFFREKNAREVLTDILSPVQAYSYEGLIYSSIGDREDLELPAPLDTPSSTYYKRPRKYLLFFPAKYERRLATTLHLTEGYQEICTYNFPDSTVVYCWSSFGMDLILPKEIYLSICYDYAVQQLTIPDLRITLPWYLVQGESENSSRFIADICAARGRSQMYCILKEFLS